MSSPPGGEEMPFLGSKINLISMSEIRYEGKHIKDLTVCDEEPSLPPPPPFPPCPRDPAIVSIELSSPPGAENSSSRGAAAARGPSKNASGADAGEFATGVAGRKASQKAVASGRTGVGGLPSAAGERRGDEGAPTQGAGGGRAGSAYPNFPANPGRGRSAHRGGSQFSGSRGGGGPRAARSRGSGPGGGPPGSSDGVVGELKGKVNQQLKSELAEDFDFDAMNSKFPRADAEKAAGQRASNSYDKNKSFFDSLSCEALEAKAMQQQQGLAEGERGRRPANRQERRALDVHTFGESAAYYSVQYMGSRRGRGRGRGGRGGGGFSRGGGGSQGARFGAPRGRGAARVWD